MCYRRYDCNPSLGFSATEMPPVLWMQFVDVVGVLCSIVLLVISYSKFDSTNHEPRRQIRCEAELNFSLATRGWMVPARAIAIAFSAVHARMRSAQSGRILGSAGWI